MIKVSKRPPSENKRWMVSWGILLIIASAVISIVIYNFSAVMTLCGKGSISLQNYDQAVSDVTQKDSGFSPLNKTGNETEGTLLYSAENQTGAFFNPRGRKRNCVCSRFHQSQRIEQSKLSSSIPID